MSLIICFFLGIANFAMHRAVMESRHPFVEDSKLYFGKYIGRNGSYFLEFGILACAMIFAGMGSILTAGVYTVYSLLNGVAVWLLLSGKV
jgi:hypothetical protein